jgi:hypothetical protein
MEIKNYKGILFFDEKGNKDTLLAKGNDFQELVLKTENFQYIQPTAFSENVFQFKNTEKAETIGVSLKIQLFYKEGITIRYEDRNGNVVAEYVIKEKNVFSKKMLQIVKFLRAVSENDFATEVGLIMLALEDKIWKTKEIKTDFIKDKDMPEETPKIGLPSTSPETWNGTFKVGDKVKVRWDFSKDLGGGASKVEYNSIENNFTITKIDKQQAIPYKEDKNGNNIGGIMRKENPSGYLYVLNNGDMWEGKDLELIDFKEETPEPKFKVGDKVKLPKTRMGNLTDSKVVVYAKQKNQDFLYVTTVIDENVLYLSEDESPNDERDEEMFFPNRDNIELYEGVPEETPYEKIDFLNPNREDEQTIINALSSFGSETIIDSRRLKVNFYDTDFSINFQKDKGNNQIYIVKTDLSGNLFSSPFITNESMQEIRRILRNLLQEVVDYMEKEFEETPDKTPEITPFQQISFLNPSTEENDVLIKTMSYYSDGLTFVNST